MTIIYFVIVLGVTVLIHEFGHFIFAKRAGVYVYEFSIGMGPRILKFRRKNDETEYSIRLFPIGGFVSMAGETVEVDDKVPLEKHIYKKPWLDRFLITIAGVTFNFMLAIVLLFVIGLIGGVSIQKPVIDKTLDDYPIASTKIESGDTITSVNGKKIRNVDRLLLELQVGMGRELNLTLKDKDGNIKKEVVAPKIEMENDKEVYKYGFAIYSEEKTGFIESIKYAFVKTFSLIEQMILIVWYLIIGKLKLNSLSGPIGIYTTIGDIAKTGILNLIYLIAYLCINVGFINILPIPAFDGGRALFLIIEKIKGSPINVKVENTIHTIGFALLMILMLVITVNDIIKLR